MTNLIGGPGWVSITCPTCKKQFARYIRAQDWNEPKECFDCQAKENKVTDFAWLDEISKRLEAATPGPWQVEYMSIVDCVPTNFNLDKVIADVVIENKRDENLEFIAHSPTDIAKLIENVKVMVKCLQQIQGHCGVPDAGEACRIILNQSKECLDLIK